MTTIEGHSLYEWEQLLAQTAKHTTTINATNKGGVDKVFKEVKNPLERNADGGGITTPQMIHGLNEVCRSALGEAKFEAFKKSANLHGGVTDIVAMAAMVGYLAAKGGASSTPATVRAAIDPVTAASAARAQSHLDELNRNNARLVAMGQPPVIPGAPPKKDFSAMVRANKAKGLSLTDSISAAAKECPVAHREFIASGKKLEL